MACHDLKLFAAVLTVGEFTCEVVVLAFVSSSFAH